MIEQSSPRNVLLNRTTGAQIIEVEETQTGIESTDRGDREVRDDLKGIIVEEGRPEGIEKGGAAAAFGEALEDIMLGDDLYYISDAVGENEVTIGDNLQINLNCDSEEELRRILSGLSINGKVTMPIEDTFWGAIFAGLTDQFGISWTLNYQKPVAENS